MDNIFFKNDIAQKTTVQIFRNLKNHKFPWRMNNEEVRSVNEQVLSAIYDSGISEKDLRIIDLQSQTPQQLNYLYTKGFISKRILENRKNKILLLSQDECISVMLNDTDHIKIQVACDGFDLQNAYKTADKLATVIESALLIAFDEHLGFLTANPADLGTAMKSSVLLNLHNLKTAGDIPSVMESVSRIGLNLAPFTGGDEGNSLYVLSNTITLGISEDNAIGNLDAIARQLMFYERG